MNRPRIVVLNGTCLDVIEPYRDWVEAQGVEMVADPSDRKTDIDQVVEACLGADAVIGPFGCSITADYFDRVPSIRVLALASSGFDTVEDPSAATRAGVVLASSPVSEGAEVVADYAWALLLSLVRRIPYYSNILRAGQYERGMSESVYGKTLGILGLGNIGKAVVRRAAGFDMRVLACDIRPHHEFVKKHNVELVSFEELLKQSDFLSLHLRLNDETRWIIGERELSLMKPTAYLINSARDELVEETALANALENRALAGAATDDLPRYEKQRLLSNPYHICTPHLGNRAIEGVHAVTRCALQSGIDVVFGKRPKYVLNPEVYKRGLRFDKASEVGIQ